MMRKKKTFFKVFFLRRAPLKGLYEIKPFFLRAPARTGQRALRNALLNPAVKVATAPFKTPSQGEGFATAPNLPLRTPSEKGVTHLGGLLPNDNTLRYWWRLADPSGGSVCYATRRKKRFLRFRPPVGRNSHKASRGDNRTSLREDPSRIAARPRFRRRSARKRKNKPP